MKLEDRAKDFSDRHHGAVGQVRKYTGEPYIVHPQSVVAIVRSVPHTEAMIAAAWAHDTVEDTEATLEDVRRELGDEVADLVEMLTDVSRPEDGNRAARKAIDRAHLAKASPAAKTIKLADLIDNHSTISQYAPKFWPVYRAELALLLEVLKEGDQTLWNRAFQLLG